MARAQHWDAKSRGYLRIRKINDGASGPARGATASQAPHGEQRRVRPREGSDATRWESLSARGSARKRGGRRVGGEG